MVFLNVRKFETEPDNRHDEFHTTLVTSCGQRTLWPCAGHSGGVVLHVATADTGLAITEQGNTSRMLFATPLLSCSATFFVTFIRLIFRYKWKVRGRVAKLVKAPV